MRRLADVIHGRLRWVQPLVLSRAYELRHDEEIVATLSFRSAFGSLATARSADGAWTFKRVGFFQTRATVRAENEQADLAVFEPHTWKGGGTLRLPDGRTIQVTTNLWQSRIEFLLEEDRVLFRYRTEGFVRQEADLEILPDAERLPELPWLLPFGWYLAVMLHEQHGVVIVS